MPDAPLADPGVRNYRTGLLRNARRWNDDHDWIVGGQVHTAGGRGGQAVFGNGFSVTRGDGICQRFHASATDLNVKLFRWLRLLSHL